MKMSVKSQLGRIMSSIRDSHNGTATTVSVKSRQANHRRDQVRQTERQTDTETERDVRRRVF